MMRCGVFMFPRLPDRVAVQRGLLRIIAGIGVIGGGCSSGTTTAPTLIESSVPLRVGQEVFPYRGGVLGVTLLSVDADSRCAHSVVCVVQGTATITIGVRPGMGPTVPVPLTWGNATTSTTVAGGVRISFDSLTPWPAEQGPLLPPAQYTAWLSFRHDTGR